MSNRDFQKGRRLLAEVMKPSPLSFDDAQARIPALVMAELAGEDVDTLYADVFVAFNHYPVLVDQYELLLEEMRSDLADPTPVPDLAPTAQFGPGKQQFIPGIVLRRLGEQVRGFLVQLMPRSLPEPSMGQLSHDRLEYVSQWVPDRQETVQLNVDLRPVDVHSWSLVVLLIPDGPTNWQVTATMGGAQLPISRRDPYETYFGPLDAVPNEPITLICQPESS